MARRGVAWRGVRIHAGGERYENAWWDSGIRTKSPNEPGERRPVRRSVQRGGREGEGPVSAFSLS